MATESERIESLEKEVLTLQGRISTLEDEMDCVMLVLDKSQIQHAKYETRYI